MCLSAWFATLTCACLAACAGITERAAHRIISDLVEHGYLTRHRLGRRNFYEVNPDAPLHHPFDQGGQAGELLKVFLERCWRFRSSRCPS